MSVARRHAYLKAMGIEVWISRATVAAARDTGLTPALARETETPRPLTIQACAPAVAEGIVIGPGAGDILLLCGKSGEAATSLAADIARSLDHEPVWGWPADPGSELGITLEQAIRERLFTRILVLGPGLVAPPEDTAVRSIGSARVIRADSIPVLLENGAARRALWLELNANHWCAGRARKT